MINPISKMSPWDVAAAGGLILGFVVFVVIVAVAIAQLGDTEEWYGDDFN